MTTTPTDLVERLKAEAREKLLVFKFNREKENGYRLTNEDYIEFLDTLVQEIVDKTREETITTLDEVCIEHYGTTDQMLLKKFADALSTPPDLKTTPKGVPEERSEALFEAIKGYNEEKLELASALPNIKNTDFYTRRDVLSRLERIDKNIGRLLDAKSEDVISDRSNNL